MACSDAEALPAASRSTLSLPRNGNSTLGSGDFNNLICASVDNTSLATGADSLEIKLNVDPIPVLQGTGRSTAGAIATAVTLICAIAGVGRDLCNWVKRRNNREPTIPAGVVDKLLFQDSVLHKYILPVASIALATMSVLHPADSGVLKELIPLLLKLAGGGVMCRYLGEEYQLICPEFAVIVMIASKMLGFASFYIVILKFITNNPLCSVLVYLSGVMAVFPLVMVVVKIFKEDVRKPEEIKGAHN